MVLYTIFNTFLGTCTLPLTLYITLVTFVIILRLGYMYNIRL